jgi:Zn-dependent M32 family carboxypeptidase
LSSLDEKIEWYKKNKRTPEEIREHWDKFSKWVKQAHVWSEKRFGREAMDEARERVLNLNKEEIQKIGEQYQDWFNKLLSAFKGNLSEDSDEVQSLIFEMQKSSSQFFSASMSRDDRLASLSLADDKNFHEMWEKIYPRGFSKFYIKATEVFIERNFQE